MILIDAKQGTTAWVRARLGIPTSSNFSKVVTRAGEPSKQAETYMRNLLAEFFIGEPCDTYASSFMERGHGVEKEARKWYEWERGVDVVEVGVCLRDDGMVGASPDGLVGEDGLVELKNHGAPVHIDFLLGGGIAGEHWQQCQGQLYVTGRKWCDLVAYSPVLPPIVHRYHRDEKYLAVLDAALNTFVMHMIAQRQKLIERGCKPAGMVPQVVGANSDPLPF